VLAYNMNTYDLGPGARNGKGTAMTNEALRTHLAVAGWDDEKARAVEDHRRRRSDLADAVPLSARPVPPR